MVIPLLPCLSGVPPAMPAWLSTSTGPFSPPDRTEYQAVKVAMVNTTVSLARASHSGRQHHKSYEKSADRWRIKTMKLTRRRVDIESAV